MNYHKTTAKCGKCGATLRFPATGLDHAKLAKALGSTLRCDGCLTPRQQAMVAMAPRPAPAGAAAPADDAARRGEG